MVKLANMLLPNDKFSRDKKKILGIEMEKPKPMPPTHTEEKFKKLLFKSTLYAPGFKENWL